MAAVALAAGATLMLSACGAGQISQTATQVAAINGNQATSGDIALRNVHVVYPNSEEFSIEPGGDAELAFTAVNLSESKSDRLKSIKTDYAGSVKIDEKDVVYFTDTNEGASGAPVADDEWRVVALHRSVRFIKGLQYMGRIVGYANAGTRIDVILEHLRAEIAAGRAQSARAIARVGPKDKGSS